MISLHKLDACVTFPSPHEALADPNGLLAFGGDLSVARLVSAYQHGIFPWFSEGEPILWWSPDPRGVVFTEKYKSSKSLLKHIRKTNPKVTVNERFNDVIDACSNAPRKDSGTWITAHMINAYKALHKAGYAHSIEVWNDKQLIGGLYGVFVNNVFCGESMFSLQTNASKVAFHYLVNLMRTNSVELIDCQMQNPHLATLGCEEIPRATFLRLLSSAAEKQTSNSWTPRMLSV
ncbi:leucyl/phenylalanyl-tRNA--protein transferase [Aliiglaciecola lipolytica]|uniref:leucyl/phenylalanyl-tRNA--protein transferase n=1 Tax=Aliiglaciecola lipolytica TaxID=477689 RepID=UPI001C090C0E|nr:leucyl/phenylalanyl-tRNA--protein transferase [Aliiglaciecola lipolytica]MBU2877194.1 leucyl/phenylalanyl-tRNA--protein transferase [Aliiglaciecola lipolytica]